MAGDEVGDRRIVVGKDGTALVLAEPEPQALGLFGRAARRALDELRELGRVLRKAWRIVAQFTAEAWNKHIASGVAKAVSIGGRALRRAATLDGRSVREIFDAALDHIALVPKGASFASDFVAKSTDDKFAELSRLVSQISAAVQADRITSALRSSDPSEVAKAVELRGEIEKGARVRDLRDELAAWHYRLERTWEHGDVNRERRCLAKIDELETELLSLGHDVRPTPHDVFAENGGTSTPLDIGNVGADFMGRPIDERVRKARADAEAAVDLMCLKL